MSWREKGGGGVGAEGPAVVAGEEEIRFGGEEKGTERETEYEVERGIFIHFLNFFFLIKHSVRTGLIYWRKKMPSFLNAHVACL